MPADVPYVPYLPFDMEHAKCLIDRRVFQMGQVFHSNPLYISRERARTTHTRAGARMRLLIRAHLSHMEHLEHDQKKQWVALFHRSISIWHIWNTIVSPAKQRSRARESLWVLPRQIRHGYIWDRAFSTGENLGFSSQVASGRVLRRHDRRVNAGGLAVKDGAKS